MRKMLTAHSQNEADQSYFVFREAANADQLLQLFQLRYQVYRNSKLAKFVPENEYGIELDCYDLRARHFGLFSVNRGAEQPIGYLRVVEDRKVSGKVDVFELLKQAPGLRCKLEGTPPCPFPLMSYFPDAHIVNQIYSKIKVHNEDMVEACRFALDNSQSRSLRLAKHMVESAVAVYFFCYQSEHALWCCDSSKKSFYRLYGFRPVTGAREDDFAGLGVSSSCVIGSATCVPSPARERVVQMAKAYGETGRICCPTNGSQFYDSVHQAHTEAQITSAVA
jgi:hypothetical protein